MHVPYILLSLDVHLATKGTNCLMAMATYLITSPTLSIRIRCRNFSWGVNFFFKNMGLEKKKNGLKPAFK